MAVIPLGDRAQALRRNELPDEVIAAVLGVSMTDLEAYMKDPLGAPLPDPDIQAKSLRLVSGGGATVLSSNGANALTKDGTAVTVP